MTAEEIRTAWLEALRSGDYQQTQSNLRFTFCDGSEAFCCLGVLCEIHPEVERIPGVGYSHLNDPYQRVFNGVPPVEVAQSVDMSPSEFSQLMHLNDAKRLTFLEIADYIERKTTPTPAPEATDEL